MTLYVSPRVVDAIHHTNQIKVALSLREIQAKYNDLFDANIDVSTVSGRVNELVAANRLERSAPVRKCNFSGKTVHPVSIVPVQLGLV